MKEALEKKYQDKTITEEELALYKKSIWIKKGIIEAVYVFILIFSFIRISRIFIFFNVLGGGGFSFYAVAIVIFYLTLFLAFGYFTFQISYMIYYEVKKKDWVPLITKLNVKLDIYSFLCKCLSILLFIMVYITTPCSVVGSSMETTFQNGDRLLCTDLYITPSKGDIIIFDASNYPNVPKISGEESLFFIKRITATEGDKVSYSTTASTTYINDVAYKDIDFQEFQTMKNSAGVNSEELSFVIPAGKIMVMGDNRNNSTDSRRIGLVSTKDIFGRVYMRLFPFTGISFY